PLSIFGCIVEGKAGNPSNVFFLTCDAFGVLPPISKLTPAQAMYHFISGYTAKVAGTEAGITEPQATFSACFGAPFLPLHPTRYASLLRERMSRHGSNVWLVNTGWSGGAYGEGERMDIDVTRALLNAALEGKLEKVEFAADSVFKVLVPQSCPGVDSSVLTPRNTWKNPDAYDEKARHLAKLFVENFAQYEDYADEEMMSASPVTG
ncbi:MAG: phosphoenolpyruvate carboxykinase (ATP), partial [Planctomycetota bacterium]|nr:phosphoenolpyruvate carboxykinase (ATP) [Planctomycetota bacterium]